MDECFLNVTDFTNLIERQTNIGIRHCGEGIRLKNDGIIRIDLRMKRCITSGLDVRRVVPRARGVGRIRVVVGGNRVGA